MSEKCPVCQAALILEEDGHKYGCYDCYFGCNPEDLPRIAVAMEAEARHDALVEAVAKEHAAFGALDEAGFQLGLVGDPIWTDHAAARAEVDRLIANNAADCKGEG